jgi:soluble lytic murein transglycosylase-like protein
MMRAVAWIESRWNPTAGSGVGAVGLMQLMPGTAQNLGVTDRTDPTQNARGGAKFLASLYKKAGSWPVALAAYNWGPGNVFGASDKPPRMYSSQWPSNTQQYVREVLEAQARGVG